MDKQRFVRLAKVLANGVNRRSIVKVAIAAIAIAGGAIGGIESASAQCGGSSSFCGGNNPPCCSGLQCVGTGTLMTCQPCGGAGAFCGGGNPTCCDGYQCTGPGPLTCQGNGGSWGDPHLTTIKGLLYDFQAKGDFVLAQRLDPDFIVQARQVSWGPNSTDVSVNSAVATRLSNIAVATCLGETPLNIEGRSVDLADGQTLNLPDGVTVSRRGNRYTVAGESGDSVSATLYGTNIDVNVGIGTGSARVGGLLGGTDNPIEVKARNGTVFTSPFSFGDFYRHYAESWRVKPDESLLTVCGEAEERAIPTKPFYAHDLDRETAARAPSASG